MHEAMPLYEYWCDDHGPFEAVRPMAEYDQPTACPCCGRLSSRALLTAPHLGGRNRTALRAHETNERAADSPKRLSSHGPGCACCVGSRPLSRTLTLPGGAKTFPGKRPWMISH